MECRTCSEALTAFLDEELTPGQRLEVESHLRDCRLCHEEHASLLYASQLVNSLSGLDLTPPSWDRVEEQIRDSKPRFFDFQSFLDRVWAPAPIAAALLILFSVPFYVSSTAERAQFEQMLASYVKERDAEERTHGDQIENRSLDWLVDNPFAVPSRPAGNNPFATE